MLPKYNAKMVTRERMTWDIMMEALEREDIAVSVETARQACLDVISLGIRLEQFKREFFSDPGYKGHTAMEMALFLAKDVEEIIHNKEAVSYKKAHLTTENTSAAMERAGVVVEADLMSSMLASYAVGGKQLLSEEWLPYLAENQVTPDDIEFIAACY